VCSSTHKRNSLGHNLPPFERVLIHCLAVLDIGADVEQPFGCLVIQNHQVMLSMGRSMDGAVKDNDELTLESCVG